MPQGEVYPARVQSNVREFFFRQFSLRALLCLVLLLSVVATTVRHLAHEALRQRQFVVTLEAAGISASFSEDKTWMPELLDTGYCDRVDAASAMHVEVEDVSPLKEFRNLRAVVMYYTQVADISPLTALKHLEEIDITTTPVSDVSALAKMENLRYLNLAFTQVTDLRPLADLKNLQKLDLRGLHVTQQQVNDLEQSLPNCTILVSSRGRDGEAGTGESGTKKGRVWGQAVISD